MSSIRFIVVAVAFIAAAGAKAGDRCEGTLCDFYYGNAPAPATTAPAAPTPMTVPSGNLLGGLFSGGDRQAAAPGSPAGPKQAPARTPMVAVGGGGVLGLARGAPAERCGGTLCDFFYGGPSPEEQREAQGGQTQPAAGTGVATGNAALPPSPGSDVEPAPVRRRRGNVEYATERQEKPQCAAPANDPWRCYRK